MRANDRELAKTVGRRLQERREGRKLSQAQVAEGAGVTRATLANIERGAANPSMGTLMGVCSAVGMDLWELFSPEGGEDRREMILQPVNGSLYQTLKGAMESGEYDSCQMLVAYAKSSGVDLLAQPLLSMRERGGLVRAYIGIDQKNTTAEALQELLQICDELYVTHDRAVAQTYHPKLYLLKGPQSIWIAVGSNNLTRGGLFTNYEACTVQRLSLSLRENSRLYEEIQGAVEQYHAAALTRPICTPGDIQQLLEAGLIQTEREGRMGLRKSDVTDPLSFGHRPVGELPHLPKEAPAPREMFPAGPGRDAPARQPSVPEEGGPAGAGGVPPKEESGLGVQAAYWFWAGKLTGGSRNILDLSENAVLRSGDPPQAPKNGFISGGVSLFGLDPKDHSARKDLTVVYRDMPYRFSTIKYAPGNANWRFQLKGKAETGKAALSQFGGDFVDHILLFYRLSDDCYILETAEGSELPALKARSRFWATNGKMKSGRPFGVLEP